MFCLMLRLLVVRLIKVHHCPGACMFLFSMYKGEDVTSMERFFSMLDTGDFRFNDELKQELSVVLKKADFDEERTISLVHVDNTCESYCDTVVYRYNRIKKAWYPCTIKKAYHTLSLKEAVDKMDATIKRNMGKVRMGSFTNCKNGIDRVYFGCYLMKKEEVYRDYRFASL